MKDAEVSIPSAFLLLMLGILTANGLDANWNLNLVWDLFFARIQGPIFYGAHATSILSVCLMAIGLIAFRYKSVNIPTIGLFGTASIHEFGLLFVGWYVALITKTPITANGISLSYAFWLVGFLVVGLKVLRKPELKIWVLVMGVVFGWYMVAMISPWPSTLNSAYFYNLGSNVSESVSWFLPVSLWVLPRRWLDPRRKDGACNKLDSKSLM